MLNFTCMKKLLRLAAVGDIHCKLSSKGQIAPMFANLQEHADALLLCGDLTDYGLLEEAHILANEIKEAAGPIPILSILGNHDYQSGKQVEMLDMLADHGIIPLDGNIYEICGVGFTGIKGFGGGFQQRSLQPWGEEAIKAFVEESRMEAMKLESSLARLKSKGKVVMLHYSPIRETVIGESPEIYPFLGSSFLEEALNRHPVTVVFHGHAHGGSPEGHTAANTPVYNVSFSMMKRLFSEKAPYRVFQIDLESLQDCTDLNGGGEVTENRKATS
jgi:Icc-related predicted phosphoesterase